MATIRRKFTNPAGRLLAFLLIVLGASVGVSTADAVAQSLTQSLAQSVELDPPGRVGRLLVVGGQVWLNTIDSPEWIGAVPNQPLTRGDRLATDTGARAEIQIGSTTVRLDGGSELEVVELDDDHLAFELREGSAIARVRDLSGGGEVEFTTDDGRFGARFPGSFRLDHQDGASTLSVDSGEVRYEGPNSGLSVVAGQRARFFVDANSVAQYSLLDLRDDVFSAWSRERDRERAAVASVAERYVSPEMTGAAELAGYGRWEQNDDYGPVWAPTAVTADWAPYSSGRWSFVQPWGWTWVDAAPWGFAPFHYGRWVNLRNRWCWAPGTRVARPVYAPALVAWVGGGGHGGTGASVGGRPTVGWFPLAPGEVYVPAYRGSARYVRNLNNPSVGDTGRISAAVDRPDAARSFENRHRPRAVTLVPVDVMMERRPVGPAANLLRDLPAARAIAASTAPGEVAIRPFVASPPQLTRAGSAVAVGFPPVDWGRGRGDGGQGFDRHGGGQAGFEGRGPRPGREWARADEPDLGRPGDRSAPPSGLREPPTVVPPPTSGVLPSTPDLGRPSTGVPPPTSGVSPPSLGVAPPAIGVSPSAVGVGRPIEERGRFRGDRRRDDRDAHDGRRPYPPGAQRPNVPAPGFGPAPSAVPQAPMQSAPGFAPAPREENRRDDFQGGRPDDRRFAPRSEAPAVFQSPAQALQHSAPWPGISSGRPIEPMQPAQPARGIQPIQPIRPIGPVGPVQTPSAQFGRPQFQPPQERRDERESGERQR